jgi:hypothetical protein
MFRQKLGRSAKQHPLNSTHLTRQFVRGLAKIHVSLFFILYVLKGQFLTHAMLGAGVGSTSILWQFAYQELTVNTNMFCFAVVYTKSSADGERDGR